MNVVKRLLGLRRGRTGHQRLRRRARGRADLRLPVREGRLEEAGPAAVAELDDHPGDQGRVRRPAPGAELATLEEAARSRSEADWIVGMNATRAATIRLRSCFDGAVSLGRVQTPTLAILARREQEIRDFMPEPYWVVDARFAAVAEPAGRNYEGRYHTGANARAEERRGRRGGRRRLRGRDRRDHQAREAREQGARAAPLRPHLAAERRQRACFGFTARRTLAAAQRLYEEHKALTYPRTNSRYITGDMVGDIKPIAQLVGGQREYAAAAQYVARARRPAARPRGQRRQGHRPPRDHPHPLRAPPGGQVLRRRPPDLRPRRAPVPRHLPSRGGLREHARGDDRRRARVPHPRQGAARPGLARRLRRDRRR